MYNTAHDDVQAMCVCIEMLQSVKDPSTLDKVIQGETGTNKGLKLHLFHI